MDEQTFLLLFWLENCFKKAFHSAILDFVVGLERCRFVWLERFPRKGSFVPFFGQKFHDCGTFFRRIVGWQEIGTEEMSYVLAIGEQPQSGHAVGREGSAALYDGNVVVVQWIGRYQWLDPCLLPGLDSFLALGKVLGTVLWRSELRLTDDGGMERPRAKA